MVWRLTLLLPAVWLVCAADAPAQGERPKVPAYVQVTATAEKPDAAGERALRVTLDIEPGAVFLASPVGLMELEDARAVVSVTAGGKAAAAVFKYPPGTRVIDAVIGDYHIYEGKVVIRGVVEPSAPDGPLEVAVRLQGFHRKGF
jgi:hypothetical protein